MFKGKISCLNAIVVKETTHNRLSGNDILKLLIFRQNIKRSDHNLISIAYIFTNFLQDLTANITSIKLNKMTELKNIKRC